MYFRGLAVGRELWQKTKEALFSVLPVVALVLLMCLTPWVELSSREICIFCICAVCLIVGIGLFGRGADLAMTPIGDYLGTGLTKSKKLSVLLSVCFAMGVLITVAEPDLSVLAKQIADKVAPSLLIASVGIGVGLFLMLSVLKIVFNLSLSHLLMFFYMCLFALAALLIETGNGDFLALAFDSGGVTTGPITVPFIMALGVGIAQTLGGKNAGENSFGLIAMCSVGPILAVGVLGMATTNSVNYQLPDYSIGDSFISEFFSVMWSTTKEVALALGMIVAVFLIFQFVSLKLPKQQLMRIIFGLIYTFVGLVLFLTAVNAGFMKIGYKIGTELAQNDNIVAVLFAFVLGAVTVLAEPAVRVLNRQVADITNNTVSRRSMMIALSVGVGISIGLSMLRILVGFSILYYLIPGYLLSLGLSFFVPKIYTAIAFDSGGVASGPLTSSFILPLAIGVCVVAKGESSVLTNAFGIVAMVAMTPLITIQLLGFRAVMAQRVRDGIARKRIWNADDEEIINFM